jgi:hypothetical protein
MRSHGLNESSKAFDPRKPPWYCVFALENPVSSTDMDADSDILYGFHGKAQRCRTAKKAISTQRSVLGIPTLRSCDWMVSDGFIAPEDVRKDMTI